MHRRNHRHRTNALRYLRNVMAQGKSTITPLFLWIKNDVYINVNLIKLRYVLLVRIVQIMYIPFLHDTKST